MSTFFGAVSGMFKKLRGAKETGTVPDNAIIDDGNAPDINSYSIRDQEFEVNPIPLGRPIFHADRVKETPKVPLKDSEAYEKVINGDTKMPYTRQFAESQFLDNLKSYENPQMKGFDKAKGKFYPFTSYEGTGGVKGHSEFEIGYGVKVLDKWISDNPANWPKINGVPTDIRQGITQQQAEDMSREIAQKNIMLVDKMPNSDKMTEGERAYWADLKYNGGSNVESKNPKAMQALKEGYTVEAMLKTLDFVGSSKGALKGLFERRIKNYNFAANSESGAPPISEYTWEEGNVKVKFDYPDFMTDKVSDKYKARIDAEGWLKVPVSKLDNPKPNERFKL